MEKCTKVAALYIAALKAISLIHQQNHWLAKGNDFYGDHLLFQRIYESAQENLDNAAEKMVTLFGDECLDNKFQADLLNKLLLKYGSSGEDLVEASLTVENFFQKLSKSAFDCFENENTMTLGLDDLLMSIASEREEAIYLLTRAQES